MRRMGLVLGSIVLIGCVEHGKSPGNGDASPGGTDAAKPPDGNGGDDGGMPPHDGGMPLPDAPPPGTPTKAVFMNFEGVAVTHAAVDDATLNRSSVVSVSATLPRYLKNDQMRATKIASIVSEVRQILAPYNVVIVTTRPPSGTYHMMVFTDAAGSAIGLPADTSVIFPTTCDTVPSVVGFEFSKGAELDAHMLAQNTISLLGLSSGIPSSSAFADCMCFNDPICTTIPFSLPCTIGGSGTQISATPSCGPAGGTMDENARFLARFGPAPI
jgi:hypothetical protein